MNANSPKHLSGSLLRSFIALALISGAVACGSDFLVDPAGQCVVCVTSASGTEPQVTLEACADGNGNITVITDGDPSTALTTERSLFDFRTPQEASGSTCN